MALATFMRSACRSYRASPAFTMAAKFTPISSLVFNSSVNRSPKPSQNSLLKVTAIREFSTSPRMLSQDHAKLWTFERGLSAALIPMTPIALLFPSIITDVFMAVSLVMHVHWGIEAIAVDYIRPIIFGNAIAKLALGAVYLISIATLVGLLNLIFNGAGLANSLRELWRI